MVLEAAGLPDNLKQALKEAAQNLNISATNRVIEDIRSHDVANGLKLFVETFEFGQIMELLGHDVGFND